MSLLEDSSLFLAIIEQGGFSHAARKLGISNGLASRRINLLERELGVTLLRRTTRQIHLTVEGEIFLEHAKRIQEEMDTALCLIQSSAVKPSGLIRINAPVFFGRYYLNPILIKFMQNFPQIKLELVLSDRKVDPIKENFDLLIRGMGYLNREKMADSSLKTKFLFNKKIGLYASTQYLSKHGTPQHPSELPQHEIVGFLNKYEPAAQEKWIYKSKNETNKLILAPTYMSNHMDCRVTACLAGMGIAKFTELTVMKEVEEGVLHPILTDYDWGNFNLYAVYPTQHVLAKRTRLLLDFIIVHTESLKKSLARLQN